MFLNFCKTLEKIKTLEKNGTKELSQNRKVQLQLSPADELKRFYA